MIDAATFERKPSVDARVPRIGLVSAILFSSRARNELRLVEPPDRTVAVELERFRPKLIAIAFKRRKINQAAVDRPKSSIAGLVTQIGVGIDAAREDACRGTVTM